MTSEQVNANQENPSSSEIAIRFIHILLGNEIVNRIVFKPIGTELSQAWNVNERSAELRRGMKHTAWTCIVSPGYKRVMRSRIRRCFELSPGVYVYFILFVDRFLCPLSMA